jgi:DNA-binding NarL/FixJ family response regulator
MNTKTRIFIVDDHPLVCEGLEQLINQENDLCVIGFAVNAEAALKAISTLKPDMVIVDISLEGKSGIELISEIKLLYPQMLILALSMHVDPLIVDRALKAGARGYVSKNEVTTVIILAIRRVIGGKLYINDTISEKLLNNIYGTNSDANRLLVESLTSREFEIFRLIGQGLGTRLIANTLNISAKTVEAHRENIKGKLCLKSARELYSYALQWRNLSD